MSGKYNHPYIATIIDVCLWDFQPQVNYYSPMSSSTGRLEADLTHLTYIDVCRSLGSKSNLDSERKWTLLSYACHKAGQFGRLSE